MTLQALAGIRVLDLGIVTAGAATSGVLADLGAEVIKIEGPTYIDPFRDWQGTGDGDWWEQSPPYRATNRNKKSACLDLKSPRGRDLFLQLVGLSDVVVENFRVGVLDKLGIGFETLRQANPRIVLASLSSQGATGPGAGNVSFGSTLEASSGLAHLTRYPGGKPQITGRALNYPDQIVSMFAAGAVMAALVERQRTGQGVHIDLAQRELSSFFVGEAFIAALDGALPEDYPVGPPAMLQALSRGEDGQWIAVTIPASASAAAEHLIGALTGQALAAFIGGRPAAEGARALRRAGAAAEVVVAARDYADPHGPAPGNALALDDAGHQVKGQPIRLGGRDAGTAAAVAPLGRDNRYVASGLLGLNDAQYDALLAEGIFATRPRTTE
ncbi:hypothetical protein ASD04_10795 [Devosia sp. Root436]|jgi:benzylsuccinate CoA-transferase BbsF subunit|uniref:CaiB/BaiF CoA transferase family protein n=1 Tax=Devosia sp. Root436 TaxID=1736537 RepID=UPI0006F5E302|nr:CoA transferase [Devosia sp. Root436]KQX38108.1 hypothetical protein ASD04_10795 [Devosia sp. Root436]